MQRGFGKDGRLDGRGEGREMFVVRENVVEDWEEGCGCVRCVEKSERCGLVVCGI